MYIEETAEILGFFLQFDFQHGCLIGVSCNGKNRRDVWWVFFNNLISIV